MVFDGDLVHTSAAPGLEALGTLTSRRRLRCRSFPSISKSKAFFTVSSDCPVNIMEKTCS